MSALAVVRSSFGSSLLRYRRSWGLWLLLLAAPVSARYWIAGEHEAYAAIVIDGKAPVLTSAVLGLSLGIIVSMLMTLGVFVYLRSNTTRRQPWQIVETTAASRIALRGPAISGTSRIRRPSAGSSACRKASSGFSPCPRNLLK